MYLIKAQLIILILGWVANGGATVYGNRASIVNTVNSRTAYLIVRLSDHKFNEQMALRLWDTLYTTSSSKNLPFRMLLSDKQEQEYSFEIKNLHGPAYFTLGRNELGKFEDLISPLIEYYVVEPGDSVIIEVGGRLDSVPGIRRKRNDIVFSGHGAAKFTARFQLDTSSLSGSKNKHSIGVFDSAYIYNFSPSEAHKSLIRERLCLLDQIKEDMSKNSYDMLKADLIGKIKYDQLSGFYAIYDIYNSLPDLSPSLKAYAKKKLRGIYLKYFRNEDDVTNWNVSLSKDYLSYLDLKVRCDNSLGEIGMPFDNIKRGFSGYLRDKLITNYFLNHFRFLKAPESLLQAAIALVKEPTCKAILMNIYDTQSSGKFSYNFSLPDLSGEIVTMEDFKGKLVFIDFWYTGCSACIGFYKYSLSKVEKEFELNKDIVFVTISIDKKKTEWIRTVKSGNYTSFDAKNVINLYTNGEGIDHPLIKHYGIYGYPYPIFFGRDGKIIRSNNLQLPPDSLIELIKRHI